jgi:uncharacterized protein
MALGFERNPSAAGPQVQGFSAEGFFVDGQSYRAVLLTPEWAMAWEPPALAELQAADLEPVLALEPPPEFLILGTGPSMAFAPRALVQALEARGIGLEAMDSRAAARTWGILRGEERWIAAALMPL